MFFLKAADIDLEKIAHADSVAKVNFHNKLLALSDMSVEDIIRMITTGIIEVALKILLALLIYFIGRWIIGRIKKMMGRSFERRGVDDSLRTFINSLVSIVLNIFMIIIIVGILGLDTTSFIALFASAGIALGMALSGTMQNFAGGVVLLLLKPYRSGDYIEAQGYAGTVKSIMLFHTVLSTPDNKTIIIPNGGISNGIINNFSKEKTRRVDWTFGMDYGQDFDQARVLILNILKKDSRILDTPTPLIAIDNIADEAVYVVVRAWANSDVFWDVYFDINEKIYKMLPQGGVEFAVGKMDVNVTNVSPKTDLPK